jgi:hydrogenase maturation protein HypF
LRGRRSGGGVSGRLRAEAPPLARIDSVAVRELAATGEAGFRIVASEVLGRVSTGIPADAATCPDCLRELLDPADRRYRYPFLNCTNCGPRFTITRRIPYDRPQTSMAKFKMCAACQAEYDDPLNRRFHAQPNACWECGPRVWLAGADGAEIAADDAVPQPSTACWPAKIVAIKGIGGFHLSVDATNEAAVMRLRERKRRYGKPLAVMVRDLEAARKVCVLTAEEEALLTDLGAAHCAGAEARGLRDCGGRLRRGFRGWASFCPMRRCSICSLPMTRAGAGDDLSANLSEEPIAIDNDEARARLGRLPMRFLMHDREILQRCDDSVAAVVDGAPQLIRRARGFVPLGVELPSWKRRRCWPSAGI